VDEQRHGVCGCGVWRSLRVRRIVGDPLRGVRLAIYSELAGVAAVGQAVAASSRAERAPGGHYVSRRRQSNATRRASRMKIGAYRDWAWDASDESWANCERCRKGIDCEDSRSISIHPGCEYPRTTLPAALLWQSRCSSDDAKPRRDQPHPAVCTKTFRVHHHPVTHKTTLFLRLTLLHPLT
jgi:hypothetical protein